MKLERNEFLLCVDSTNAFALWDEESYPVKKQGLIVKDQIYANVRDSIAIEKLDEKWQIDTDKFLEKMRNATEEEYKELWQQIEDYWAKRDRDE